MDGASYRERMVGASCRYGAEDVRKRLREWSALKTAASDITDGGDEVSMALPPDLPMTGVVDLLERESDCCPFYTFDLRIDGPVRRLTISAGEGGGPAARALLGLSA